MIYGEKFINNINKYTSAEIDDYIDEGATAEYIAVAKKYKSQYKAYMQSGQKKYKNSQYKEAKKDFEKAIDACDNIEKEFKKITSDNALSVVSGAITHIVVKFGVDIVLGCLLACVGIGLISIDLAAPARAINLIKSWDKNNISKSANLYRNDVEYGLKAMRKSTMDWMLACK